MSKHAKIISFFLLITIPFLCLGLQKNSRFFNHLTRGSYFFAKTINNPNITKIVLSFSNNNTVSFENKNNLWRIKEADDYFASLPRTNSLIKLLRNTTVLRTDKFDGNNIIFDKNKALKIETFDKNNKLVDIAYIAPKGEKNKYHSAILNNDSKFYLISEEFNLLSNPIDWVTSPILSLNENNIRSVVSDNINVYRDFSGQDFLDVNKNETCYLSGLINNFSYLNALEVRHSINFDYKKFKKIKTYEISLFNGGIFNIYIYSDNKEYWVNVKVDRTNIVNDKFATWINENSILYDGWFFKIDKDSGNIISNFYI